MRSDDTKRGFWKPVLAYIRVGSVRVGAGYHKIPARGAPRLSDITMKTLIRQLLERAETASGEDWIRQCLTLPLNADPGGSSMDVRTAAGASVSHQ